LDGCTYGYDLIGIDIGARLHPEILRDSLTHQWNSSRPSHQNDVVELSRTHLGEPKRLIANHEGPIHEVRDPLLEAILCDGEVHIERLPARSVLELSYSRRYLGPSGELAFHLLGHTPQPLQSDGVITKIYVVQLHE